MSWFFIMNPGSAGAKSREKIKKVLEILTKRGIDFEYRLTDTLEDAYHLSGEANTKGYEVIVAVGGDGTINRVINGFYDSNGRRVSGSKLGVIHTGTSPDFCKSYNIPLETETALNTILAGKSKQISLGKISYTCVCDQGLDGQRLGNQNKNVQTSYFACCANIGLGASVARSANSGIRKYLGDFAGTFVSLLTTLLIYKPGNFTVSFDGEQQVLTQVYNISVGKTIFIASGIKLKHDLSPAESRLYNLIIKDLGLADLASVIPKIYSGKSFANSNTMTLRYAKVIEVYGSSLNPELEFDGDPRGFLPCVIEAAQDPLDLICEVSDE